MDSTGAGSSGRILGTTCASHGLIHVYELSVPALLIPIQAEFSAGDFEMGRVVALYGLLFGLGALPAGWLVDRFGSKNLLVACLWSSSAALLAMGLSPSLALFALASALMGLGLSIYHPAGTALVSQLLPNSGRVFAFHGMAGNLGVAGAAVIAASLGQLFGWRTALIVLSLAGWILGGLVLRFPRAGGFDAPAKKSGGALASFAWLLVAAGFMGMVYRGMTTFLPKLFTTSYAEDSSAGLVLGGGLTTATLIVGLVGMYWAGRLLDHGWSPVRVFAVGALFQFPFLVAMASVPRGGLLPLAMGVAFFHFMTQPAGNQLVAHLTPARLRGLGYGIYFFLVFGIGALGAGIGGWASERWGLVQIFPVLAVLLVPAFGALFGMSRLNRGRAKG